MRLCVWVYSSNTLWASVSECTVGQALFMLKSSHSTIIVSKIKNHRHINTFFPSLNKDTGVNVVKTRSNKRSTVPALKLHKMWNNKLFNLILVDAFIKITRLSVPLKLQSCPNSNDLPLKWTKFVALLPVSQSWATFYYIFNFFFS